MQLKEPQAALTVEEQIENLKNLNLTITDTDFAKQFQLLTELAILILKVGLKASHMSVIFVPIMDVYIMQN